MNDNRNKGITNWHANMIDVHGHLDQMRQTISRFGLKGSVARLTHGQNIRFIGTRNMETLVEFTEVDDAERL